MDDVTDAMSIISRVDVSSEVTETAGPALVQKKRRRDCAPRLSADGVARRGDAYHPQARGLQERSGGKTESAHGVQVGIFPAMFFLSMTRRMNQPQQLYFI